MAPRSRIHIQAAQLDKKIIELMEKRVQLISRIPPEDTVTRVPLRKPLARCQSGLLDQSFLEQTVEGLFDQARSRECAGVAFLGPEATFSHMAVNEFFGGGGTGLPKDSLPDVFAAVLDHTARFGVVPVENSIEGGINVTLDMLRESSLSIYGETTLLIVHHLMGKGTLKDIQEVYSHTQILGQCRNWLRKNLPHANQVATSSSAAAVRKIGQSKKRAAIGTELAAKLYGGKILARGIQDYQFNRTRFLIIAREEAKPGKVNKTSIVFLCDDKPGALVETLKIFKQYGINLTKIESRPSKRRNWEYSFFVDFLGHHEDPKVRQALNRLRKKTIYVKVMGSYPTHTEDGLPGE